MPLLRRLPLRAVWFLVYLSRKANTPRIHVVHRHTSRQNTSAHQMKVNFKEFRLALIEYDTVKREKDGDDEMAQQLQALAAQA